MKFLKIRAISYGLGNGFEISKFKPIENRLYRNKPFGGLWCSPIDSKYGWKEWCNDNEFGDLDSSFEILYEGNTIIINSEEDLEKLTWTKFDLGMPDVLYPDFEVLIKREVDGIFLTEKGEQETRWTIKHSLYGWDCESLLILNSASIKSL